jgi:MarR-like DNA-binding transcriptional regulator SgrR of sgrS sRNA
MDPKAEQQARDDEFEQQLTRLQLIKPIYSAVNVIQRNERLALHTPDQMLVCLLEHVHAHIARPHTDS